MRRSRVVWDIACDFILFLDWIIDCKYWKNCVGGDYKRLLDRICCGDNYIHRRKTLNKIRIRVSRTVEDSQQKCSTKMEESAAQYRSTKSKLCKIIHIQNTSGLGFAAHKLNHEGIVTQTMHATRLADWWSSLAMDWQAECQEWADC